MVGRRAGPAGKPGIPAGRGTGRGGPGSTGLGCLTPLDPGTHWLVISEIESTPPGVPGDGMARHNREGSGEDQSGHSYEISYQPDWLRVVKVTRDLPSGRQSTKILFRNPLERAEAPPGDRIRTGIRSAPQDLDFEVAITDPHAVVTRVRVACRVPDGRGSTEKVEFLLTGKLPPSSP